MGAVLAYSVNVALLLVLMYVVYKWLLASESFHAFNRGLLLAIYAIALIAAPLTAVVEQFVIEEPSAVSGTSVPAIVAVGDVGAEERPILPVVLLCVYLAGVVVMIGRSVVIWSRIVRVIASGERQSVGRYRLVVSSQKDIAPFSWCRYIVMSREDYEQASEMIVTHEMQHLRHLHWVDLLIAEAVIIFNWFNPAAWLMRDELQSVHEYQADMAVLRSGVNAKNYQLLLIKKAVGYRFPSLANSLNHSKLKKRIAMMMKNQSKKRARLRAIAIVPAVAVALSVVNQSAVASALSALSCAEIPHQTTESKSSEKSATAKNISESKSAKIVVLGDSLKGRIKTVRIRGGQATETEKTQTVKVHRGIQAGDLDGAEITIDGVKATAAQAEALPEEYKKNAYVAVSSDGYKSVKIVTKSNPDEYEAVFYYINGEEVEKTVIDSIKPEQIQSVTVDKTDGKKMNVFVIKK